MKLKYNHTVEAHNMQSPREIVPIILQFLQPYSVVDVGCGLGTFVRAFKEAGIPVTKGIDGSWVKKELLFENIQKEDFIECNLEDRITLKDRFDLAICLEVAEHLSVNRADSFIKDLTKLSDVIVFGAAIPFQGGDNHLNEQWPEFWIDKFEKNGYKVKDVLKNGIWNNKKIYVWYKQNILLFVKQGSDIEQSIPDSQTLSPVVHPELLALRVDYRDKNAIKRYTKGLLKSISYKLGFIK